MRTYDEILEEYEKFFALDEEILKQEAKKNKSSSGVAGKVGATTGNNKFMAVELDFAQSIIGGL